MLSLLALRARSTATRVLLSIAGSALLSLSPAREIAPLPPRVVSFDVGQGDATVVEGRSGALLIDGGRAFGDSLDMGRRVVVPGLAALGIEALDLVIASHADLDHRGGLETVLRRVPVRVLWLPRGSLEEPGFRRLLEIANERGVTVVERGAGDPPTRFGDLRVLPIWPPRDNAPIGRNDSSLVVRVEVFEAGEVLESVLLPGDLGAVAERRLIELDVELRSTILKVGHHGSRGSSTGEFLAVVRPEIALVSAPCFGRGGLPSASSMQRLRESSAEVWWTGSSGAVIVGLTTRSRTRTVTGWHQNVQCWKH
jgi:competence protein ComEC